jgi:predicted GIY-YIG superfamily endonuclease
MHYVYILRSRGDQEQTYVGATADLRRRLGEHNSGKSRHTARRGPWTLEVALAFRSQQAAEAFESYLKTGSGRAFAKRHFLTENP